MHSPSWASWLGRKGALEGCGLVQGTLSTVTMTEMEGGERVLKTMHPSQCCQACSVQRNGVVCLDEQNGSGMGQLQGVCSHWQQSSSLALS